MRATATSRSTAAAARRSCYGDLLIFNCDGNYDEAFVVALDTRTGKERWRTNRRSPADQAYTTPLVIRVGERDQLISVGAYRAYAYDPTTGREIWRVSYDEGFSNVPRPVFGHGLVFIATGFQSADADRRARRRTGRRDALARRVDAHPRRAVHAVADSRRRRAVRDQRHRHPDDGRRDGPARIHYQQRLGGNYSASPVFADGRIYFQSEEGVTTVIAPGRQFGRLATNRLDGSTLASMAIVPGAIFIRSDTHLYRIGGQTPPPTGV